MNATNAHDYGKKSARPGEGKQSDPKLLPFAPPSPWPSPTKGEGMLRLRDRLGVRAFGFGRAVSGLKPHAEKIQSPVGEILNSFTVGSARNASLSMPAFFSRFERIVIRYSK